MLVTVFKTEAMAERSRKYGNVHTTYAVFTLQEVHTSGSRTTGFRTLSLLRTISSIVLHDCKCLRQRPDNICMLKITFCKRYISRNRDGIFHLTVKSLTTFFVDMRIYYGQNVI